MTHFSELGLSEPIQKAVAAQGYETATPIQAQAIPHLLGGRDLLGIAQTGTGKTAAFALPLLDRLAQGKRPPAHERPRALILSPTRELASQIAASFEAYGKQLRLSVRTVFGGVPIRKQFRQLKDGVDILVATPGRLIDLIEQEALTLAHIEVLVLDEADQMLDLGFIHALRRIVPMTPPERQTVLFSATMPKSIAALAEQYLTEPVTVSITPAATTAERVEQRVVHMAANDKPAFLVECLKDRSIDRVLIFSRTKHGADRIVKRLKKDDFYAEAIHGNKKQTHRERTLKAFRTGELWILVATDIAARGIDIPGVSHVINFDMPNVPDQYVHRIGRTARAGRDGLAISFVAPDEKSYLRSIERLIRQTIPSEKFIAEREAPAPEARKVSPRPAVKVHERALAGDAPEAGSAHAEPLQETSQPKRKPRRPRRREGGEREDRPLNADRSAGVAGKPRRDPAGSDGQRAASRKARGGEQDPQSRGPRRHEEKGKPRTERTPGGGKPGSRKPKRSDAEPGRDGDVTWRGRPKTASAAGEARSKRPRQNAGEGAGGHGADQRSGARAQDKPGQKSRSFKRRGKAPRRTRDIEPA